jgi:phage host-nuclease inhibitor protein Gam
VDLNRIIQNLKAERDALAAAIECLEQLAAGRAKKRGRPPSCLRERGAVSQLLQGPRSAFAKSINSVT